MEKKMIKIKAPAKLNLGLNVLGIRSDNYHELDTIFVMVDIYDNICLMSNDNDIIIKCNHPLVPNNSHNIAFKAAKKIQSYFGIDKGVIIDIDKNIPVGGGMAGGSSDAAAVLRTLPVLWDINVKENEIENIAKSLGADVWYCYQGGIMRGQGIGDKLTPIPSSCKLQFAVLPQPWSISTPKVFSAWDKLINKHPVNINSISEALIECNVKILNSLLGNSLEDAVTIIQPEIKEILSSLRNNNINGQITGSGSTLFILLSNKNDIIRLKEFYKGNILYCNLLHKFPNGKTCTI